MIVPKNERPGLRPGCVDGLRPGLQLSYHRPKQVLINLKRFLPFLIYPYKQTRHVSMTFVYSVSIRGHVSCMDSDWQH